MEIYFGRDRYHYIYDFHSCAPAAGYPLRVLVRDMNRKEIAEKE